MQLRNYLNNWENLNNQYIMLLNVINIVKSLNKKVGAKLLKKKLHRQH
jgi:hypothetical protein